MKCILFMDVEHCNRICMSVELKYQLARSDDANTNAY